MRYTAAIWMKEANVPKDIIGQYLATSPLSQPIATLTRCQNGLSQPSKRSSVEILVKGSVSWAVSWAAAIAAKT